MINITTRCHAVHRCLTYSLPLYCPWVGSKLPGAYGVHRICRCVEPAGENVFIISHHPPHKAKIPDSVPPSRQAAGGLHGLAPAFNKITARQAG